MRKAVFFIDGADFTDCIKAGGVKWKKYDLESEKAGRTLDGLMHRSRIGRKRQIVQTCRRLSDARLRQLVNALDREFVLITYPDPQYGETTKTFYGTEVESSIWAEVNGELFWEDTTFTLTER